ncbi:MAG: hypothetical protein QOG67_3064, partial [Verrucomicrobiota bacterium]
MNHSTMNQAETVQALRETNSRLLAQLDELQCQLQPLRLQVEALTKT